MYSLIKSHTLRSFAIEQVPAILIALIITELFGGLGSFMIETAVFMVSWFVVDWAYQMLRNALAKDKKTPIA